MRAIAMALQLRNDYFDDMFRDPSAWMAMWSYPAHLGEERNSWGVGPHTDHEVLTMVLQDEVGGLEVQTPDGEWIDVPPIPGDFCLSRKWLSFLSQFFYPIIITPSQLDR